MAICTPIHTGSGTLIGVIRAFVNMEDTFKASIALTTSAANAGAVKIVDNSGAILYTTSDKTEIMSNKVNVASLTSFKNAVAGVAGYVTEPDEIGVEMLTGYSVDPTYGYICLVSPVPATAYKPVS